MGRKTVSVKPGPRGLSSGHLTNMLMVRVCKSTAGGTAHRVFK